jgi:hypothetical protein
VQGFGYAFQDQIGVLQDNVATPVANIQTTLNKIVGENIDKKIVNFFGDSPCSKDFLISMEVIRQSYSALNLLI